MGGVCAAPWECRQPVSLGPSERALHSATPGCTGPSGGSGGSQKHPENWTAPTGTLASESTGGLIPTSKGSDWGLSPWTVGLCPALGGVLAQMLPQGQRPRPPLGGRDLPPEAEGQQYLDPVHWVMNDGSLRFLQEKEAQRMERGR